MIQYALAQIIDQIYLVVCAFPKNGSEHYDVYVAAQNDEELERFEQEFGIQLSWN